MFQKKREISEEELEQKRRELDASLHKAELKRQDILKQKCLKLKNHSLKVNQISKASNLLDKTDDALDSEITQHSRFLIEINQSDSLEKFQLFMQRPETVSSATFLVSFLEKYCSTETCNAIKNRPKVFMSLALLAHYPSEVMPNATREEKVLLSMVKEFYDKMMDFFSFTSDHSDEKHSELSWCWNRAIHIFDEWLTKDKQVLFEKMTNDFLIWVKTVGNLSINDPSRSDWEHHAVIYQNEILKRVFEVFGQDHVEKLITKVGDINEEFVDSKFFIKLNQNTGNFECGWQLLTQQDEPKQKLPENNQADNAIYERLKATNIRILHELMLKENNIDFEGILRLSGKSMKEISDSNRENLSRLISILGNESDSFAIVQALQELFQATCLSLKELAGENEDYCQEIDLTDCNIDSTNWIRDSCELLRWILSMCRRCCAPARDQTCQELELCIDSIDDDKNLVNSFTNTFVILFDLLNGMRSDFCNFRLRVLAAQIDGKGIAEQYELQELDKTFSSEFQLTKEWLCPRNDSSCSPLELLADSYLNMFDPCLDEVTDVNAPETFYLDIQRIGRYREELKLGLMSEAALIYLKNHLRTLDNQNLSCEDILSDLKVKASLATTVNDLRDVFSKIAHELDDSEQSLLKGNISRLFRDPIKDKVFILMKNREISKIRSVLINEQNSKHRQETIIEKICSLFRYNKSCFSSIYDKIILERNIN